MECYFLSPRNIGLPIDTHLRIPIATPLFRVFFFTPLFVFCRVPTIRKSTFAVFSSFRFQEGGGWGVLIGN